MKMAEILAWCLANWQYVLAAFCAALILYVKIAKLIPGDQKEKQVEDLEKSLEKYAKDQPDEKPKA